ncbi:amino acid permease [Fulvivirga maritima]|uniref:amino acid permease n=1 Tax=Fulvivirga maritima TaxID=2904247 RepID=UPI001F465F87|nr:amino acid permease [Fulvivirga maritima]UII25158.1 amino acid permease [Fulvivirga maritima]
MSTTLREKKAGFGTGPVFFTAISTILGAIMFLRFGYAVGSVGFAGTIGIILFANLVTIPTAMAIAEIATNQKVEGGGEYYIISRSFGINVGAAIGIALYLSQAISVAFYTIAFAEAFGPVFDYVNTQFDLNLSDKRIISLPAVILLSILMIKKGADLGMKALYVVVAILFLSLIMFFVGSTDYNSAMVNLRWTDHIDNPDTFFAVFAIVFPAFTGMTAGVGLSGDLRDPKKSIPLGTLAATIVGMVIYIFIAYKLAVSAAPGDLVEDPLIMMRIAALGPIIPIGLAAATISSALGSIMVAPRTLQALASDKVFPLPHINTYLAKGKKGSNDPINATIVTSLIAIVFVSLGDVNAVAEIISMFFMITYGSLCLISFLQHFAADPSYRPSFRSKWYVSLLGAVLCVYLMFKMNAQYTIISIILMTGIYFFVTQTSKSKEGLAKIFQGVIFQLSRQLQVFLQKAERGEEGWRPSVICISSDFFKRPAAFQFMKWISHRYGFGTYLHYINGYFSKDSYQKSQEQIRRLLKVTGSTRNKVFVDTLISPSFTSAVAQAIQLPSVSGKEVNMILFEFAKDNIANLTDIIDNFTMVKAAEFDICVLGSSDREFGFNNSIHIWLTPNDLKNSSLMILMGYIIMGHRDWKNAEIKIFAVVNEKEMSEQEEMLISMIKAGRLPISPKNIELIKHKLEVSTKEIINDKSQDADLTIVGFRAEAIKQRGAEVFKGYEGVGNILFVNASKEKEIQ